MRIHKGSNEKFPRFALDERGYFADKTCFTAIGKSLDEIVMFLNSSIGKYLLSKYVSILDNGGYLMQKIYIEAIPIPASIKEILHHISINECMLCDYKIDQVLYAYFNLSEVEIAYIESPI